MKNKIINVIVILSLCCVLFAGCSMMPTPDVVPTPEATSTPEATPTPTPEPTPKPWVATFNKYKDRMGGYVPWWVNVSSGDQKVVCILSLIDRNEFKNGRTYEEYITDFLKRYNLDNQLETNITFSSALPMIYGLVVDIETAEKMLQSLEIGRLEFVGRLDKNGNIMPTYLYTYENDRIEPPYTYDEDWNLIYPNGPVYNFRRNMVYDENGKRVVTNNETYWWWYDENGKLLFPEIK